MVEMNRKVLMRTEKRLIKALDSEFARNYYLESVKNDDDGNFSKKYIKQTELVIELSREYHRDSDPEDNVVWFPETDAKRVNKGSSRAIA